MQHSRVSIFIESYLGISLSYFLPVEEGRLANSGAPAYLGNRVPISALFQDKRLQASESFDAFIVFRFSQPKDARRKAPASNDSVFGADHLE